MEQKLRKWTPAEERVLLNYVRNYPFNLSKCFSLVSEHLTDAGTPRTASAVGAHWYQSLSKKPEALTFLTVSSKHIAKNRKNGMGIASNNSIWQRILRVIRNL